MRLLRIDSSARGRSITRQLTSAFVEACRSAQPGIDVLERDLATTALPLITDEWSATFADPAQLTPGQREYLAISDALISELLAADLILIGAPMYNFTVSSVLKAWIDQVVRLGKTVSYEAAGANGLLSGKKVIVVTSRGGSYSMDFGARNFDYEEAYLRRVLAFIGLNEVTFIHAENQMRKEDAGRALAAALRQIASIAAQTAATLRTT